MAKTLKDVLKLMNNRINSNELSAALGASNPLEATFEDDIYSKIETQLNGLLSIEEAKNNNDIFNALKPKIEKTLESELHQKHKRETLFGVETELKKIAKKRGLEFEGEKKWNEILSEIDTNWQSGDADERVTSLQNANNKLNETVSKLKQARKDDNQIIDNLPLQQPYQEPNIKKTIVNGLMDAAKTKAHITLTEQGQLDYRDPSNPDLELFVDNKKPELLDLIGEEAQPYIEAKPAVEGGPKSPQSSEGDKKPVFTGTPADVMARHKASVQAQIMGE